MILLQYVFLIPILLLVGCSSLQPASPFQQALETLTKSLPRIGIASTEKIIIYGCFCKKQPELKPVGDRDGQPAAPKK